MPIIDGRSNVKFDAVIRTAKADALMSFISASYNAKSEENPKEKIITTLKPFFDLFRESGSGAYGSGITNIDAQFSRNYTMGMEMGIWIDSQLHLNELAKKVARYEITVKDYISTVFLNLFTFFEQNNNKVYHHYLYEVINNIINKKVSLDNIPKKVISETLPSGEYDKNNEQTNLLVNYLIATNYFFTIDNEHIAFYKNDLDALENLLGKCNLEYRQKSYDEAIEMVKNKKSYSDYVTKIIQPMEENYTIKVDDIQLLSHNQIYSGAPGTGKSYNVSKLVKEYYPDFENEENEQSQFVFRTTLHPEYTYSDFVGQIMPVTKDDKIDYDFIPGVFTRALEKAISFEQTNQKVFLILEELSRANVASVFGDLFQLLDRKNGKSEYPISNSLIAKEVFHSGPLKNEDGSINKENERLQNKKIYLPSNLYILCTVNTSDQNVFVMDTAFKRRFDWIPVLTDPVKDLKTGDYINNPEITIDGVKLKWCEFYPILNNYITSKMGLSEDKQIGQFFIKFDDNSSTEVVQTLLKNKLLLYLWDDVENAAYSKKLFEGITSFSELYKKFGVTQIFNAELITELNNIKNSDIEMTNDNQSIELNNNVELDENLVEE